MLRSLKIKFMKSRSSKILSLAIVFLVIVLSLFVWKGWYAHQTKVCHFCALKNPHKNLSVIARTHSKNPTKVATAPDVALAVAPTRTIPLVPSPLDHPSEEELKRFPGAIVVEAVEVNGPEPGQKIWLRILKTHFKYPFLRTEEVIDTGKNSVMMREEMVADHLLVTLPEGTDPEAFLKNFGPQGISIVRVTPDAPLYRLNLVDASLSGLPEALDQVVATTPPNTKLIGEPDFICQTLQIPNNPYYQYQWGLWKPKRSFNMSTKQWNFCAGINAGEAWNIRTDASSIVVAVVDSGIRYTHEAIAPNMWHNPMPVNGDIYGWNSHDNNGDPMDNNGHGTHCAGVIGGVSDSGLGVAGVAWKVQLMACKIFDGEGQGTDSDGTACIDYACDHGAKIINCSWGHGTAYSVSLLQSMDRARLAGIIVVAAAGNESSDNDEHPFYPASCQLDNILSVAATGMTDDLVTFAKPTNAPVVPSIETGSNYGAKSVHLAAPGDLIISAWADADNSYKFGSGTSCAAPYVSGSLALLEAQYPNASYQELIAHLLDNTDKTPKLTDKVRTGRLNIGKALQNSL